MRSPCPAFMALALLATQTVATSSLSAQALGVPLDTIARGKRIYESTCRACHTLTPPPQGGPVMSRIAQHYVQRLGSRTEAAARIAEWLAGPSIEKSLLPKDEVARFGLMPHQPLADAGRFAVAAYIVTLSDAAPRQGRRGRRP